MRNFSSFLRFILIGLLLNTCIGSPPSHISVSEHYERGSYLFIRNWVIVPRKSKLSDYISNFEVSRSSPRERSKRTVLQNLGYSPNKVVDSFGFKKFVGLLVEELQAEHKINVEVITNPTDTVKTPSSYGTIEVYSIIQENYSGASSLDTVGFTDWRVSPEGYPMGTHKELYLYHRGVKRYRRKVRIDIKQSVDYGGNKGIIIITSPIGWKLGKFTREVAVKINEVIKSKWVEDSSTAGE